MKKKLLALLCVLIAGACVLAAVVMADSDVISVGTIEELNTAISKYTDAPKYIQLTADMNATIAVGKTVYLDLNGNDITSVQVEEGCVLYCMDSATDTYEDVAYGKIGAIGGKGEVKPVPAGKVGLFEEVVGYTNIYAQSAYMKITEDDGTSFHRVYMEISSVVLRANADPDKMGVYYISCFAGDSKVKDNVKTFGVALSLQNLDTDEKWSQALADSIQKDENKDSGKRTCLYSTYNQSVDAEKFVAGAAGKTVKRTGALLKNIMDPNVGPMTNQYYASMNIYGRSYVQTKDGQLLFGDSQQACNTLQKLTEYADKNLWDTLEDDQKQSLVSMYNAFPKVINNWNIPNIKVGDKQNEATLVARRNQVVKYMSDMMNVQWSVVEDITYTVEGAGDITLPAYDNQGNQIIYQGVPYTDGTGSLNAWETYSVNEDNGVHTLYGISAESLEGAAAGQGNDGANAVYWAWSQISDSISFDDVADMTSGNGCVELGNYSELKKGDALVQYSDGRAMLVTQVTIVKSSDGSIDSAKSTVTTLEQSSDKELSADTNASGTAVYALAEGRTYTFDALSADGFLPITCAELQSAAESKAQSEVTYANNTVTSNLPMEYVKVTVTRDGTDGGVTKESYVHEKDGATSITLPTASELQAEVNKLGYGTYTITYQCKLAGVNALQTFKTETQTVAENADYEVYYLDRKTDASGNVTGYFSTDVIKDAVASKTINYYFMSGEGKTMDTSAKVALKQGDSCLVVFPNGETMLIDVAMKEYYPILEHNLKRLGITHIDYVLLSHPHDDHCGGLWAGVNREFWNSTIKNYDYSESTLLRTFSVDEVFHSGLKNSGWESTGKRGSVSYTDTHLHVTDLIKNYKALCGTSCKETIVKMGDELTFGKGDRAVTINVLWPGDVDITVTEELSHNSETQINTFTENYVAEGQSLSVSGDVNNRSIVMRLDYGEHSSLFAGDLYQTYKTGGMSSIYQAKETLAERYVKQGSMNDTMGAENALVGYYTQQGKINLLNTDLLKMTHHGDASSSNTPDFFKAVSPQYAVATGFLAAETHWALYKTVNSSGKEIRFVDTTQGNEGKDTNFFFDRWNGYTHVTAYSDTDGNMNVETSRHEYIYSHEATYTYTDTNSEYIKEGAYLYFGKNWTYRTEAEKEAQKPKY